MKKTLLLMAVILVALVAEAQVSTPSPSPLSTLTQRVGLVDIKVEYSRPSLRGRKMFGETLPFGELWRTGANGSTKLSFSDDVKINGTTLAKGTYSLLSIPGPYEWTIILNKNTNIWGNDGYKPEEDALRFKVKPEVISNKVETLTISVGNIKDESADIELTFETTKIVMNVTMDTDNKVMTSIKRAMDGPSADSYFQAAVYYLEHNKDANQALEWINKAIEKGSEYFWVYRQKSLIEAKLGKTADAIKTAERSLALAKEAKNNDYIRMNERSIAEWKKK